MKLIRKEYTTPEEKKKDFWRGFWLWWGLNVALWIIQTLLVVLVETALDGGATAQALSIFVGLLPLLINIGLLIYLALTRSQMALGLLAAFGSALAIAILLGIILTVACFVVPGVNSLL